MSRVLDFARIKRRFDSETGFEEPLKRKWTITTLEKFVEGDLKVKFGGVINPETTLHQFKEILRHYLEIHVKFVLENMKKDKLAASSMMAAVATAAAAAPDTTDAGFLLWGQDPTGDDPGFQDPYDDLGDKDQKQCLWLQ